MLKKILILIALTLTTLFMFCACNTQPAKTATSISTSVKVEGMQESKKVIITAKEKNSGEQIKLHIGEDEIIAEIEPGIYVITRVETNDKRIVLTLKEQYFTVNKSHKLITLTVAEEYKKSGIEWFLYNNSLYLTLLVGCFIFLGVYKHRKAKAEH